MFVMFQAVFAWSQVPVAWISSGVAWLSDVTTSALPPGLFRSMIVDGANPCTREFRATVTYHDSCHLAHGLGVREAPRELIRSVPGVRLVELAESDLCCGSAGSYNLTEPAMARALAARKVANIIATDADYVILSNPGCEFQIAAELRRQGAKTQVIHLADFLALASNGTPRPDDRHG